MFCQTEHVHEHDSGHNRHLQVHFIETMNNVGLSEIYKTCAYYSKIFSYYLDHTYYSKSNASILGNGYLKLKVFNYIVGYWIGFNGNVTLYCMTGHHTVLLDIILLITMHYLTLN